MASSGERGATCQASNGEVNQWRSFFFSLSLAQTNRFTVRLKRRAHPVTFMKPVCPSAGAELLKSNFDVKRNLMSVCARRSCDYSVSCKCATSRCMGDISNSADSVNLSPAAVYSLSAGTSPSHHL